jgi:hypothetical protein
MTEEEVALTIETFKTDWPGSAYDLLRCNCVIFCNSLSKALGAGPLPAWLTNLASDGAAVCDGTITVVTKAQAAAIIAQAKAGEIDDKYKISGTAHAKADDFLETVKQLDQKYKLREGAAEAATDAARKSGNLATQLATSAQDLDRQYQICDSAATVASRALAKGGDLASTTLAYVQDLDEQHRLREQTKQMASQIAESGQSLASSTLARTEALASRALQPIEDERHLCEQARHMASQIAENGQSLASKALARTEAFANKALRAIDKDVGGTCNSSSLALQTAAYTQGRDPPLQPVQAQDMGQPDLAAFAHVHQCLDKVVMDDNCQGLVPELIVEGPSRTPVCCLSLCR